MKTASWVIINIATNQAVFETFNENTARAVNARLYKAVPILEWLQHLNRTYKSQDQWPSIQTL
jgi:hypothetical protein